MPSRFSDQVPARFKPAVRAIEALAEDEDCLAALIFGSIMAVDDIPYYFYVDDEGDQTALPCTERLISERTATLVRGQGFLPLLSIKGRPEVRLGGFNSLAELPRYLPRD